IWAGRVNILELTGYAIQILPKLRIHEENVMEKLWLNADKTEHTSEILKTENNSIWAGRVNILELIGYAIQILPKLRIHEENEMEMFYLNAGQGEHIDEVLEMKNSSIWAGRVKKLSFSDYAIEILPKLRIHGDNVMECFTLDADKTEHTSEILKTENNSIWAG
ncbi:MAG: uncharacterized protein A8A55_3552, partial [Amphiamblys sp. WSBS2006]